MKLNIEQPERLRAYLQRSGRIEVKERPSVRSLPGGVSNRTVLVEQSSGERWVLKQALRRLRVPVEWTSSPRRVHHEAEALRWLPHILPRGSSPRLIFEDPQECLLAMEAVPEPHFNWKQQLLSGQVRLRPARRFGEVLARLHTGAWKRRETLPALFQDRSFFESLRLEPYYAYSAAAVPAAAGFLNRLIWETRQNVLTLVHGDFSPKNVLLRGHRLVLIDYEVVHLGDPAFDLGFALTHFLSKARHLARSRQRLLQAARVFWSSYGAGIVDMPWAAAVKKRAVHHTLGCLLARVSGRSQLEYLGHDERHSQRQAALEMMTSLPRDVPDLLETFGSRL